MQLATHPTSTGHRRPGLPALILLTCALLAPAHADAQALRPVAQPSAQEDAEILAREPRSANPYLAFLPAGVVPDYEWWNAKLRAESRRRQAEQAPPGRVQNFFEIEPNDSTADPDFLPGFGTGPGDDPAASVTGTGNVFQDFDFFSVQLDAGDVLGVATNAGGVAIYDPSSVARMLSGSDATGLYPPSAPLPSGSVTAAVVAATTGLYFVRVAPFTFTNYVLLLQASRPGTELADATQILFVDFDGATVNPSIFGGPNGNVSLSPLSSFLGAWGLGAGSQNAVIDSILATIEENLGSDLRAKGNNPGHDVVILNSRDDPDPFGQPNVARLIVGGTIAQLGIDTIGIAQFIDPGNFALEDSAVVLLDLLSGPSNSPNSLNRFPIAAGASKVALVGRAVGNITAHEAGHFLGNYHTDQANGTPNIQDQGGNLPGTAGVGPDGIFGNGDDVDVDFVQDFFVQNEGFAGLEDTLNHTAFALTGRVVFRNGFESGNFGSWAQVVP